MRPRRGIAAQRPCGCSAGSERGGEGGGCALRGPGRGNRCARNANCTSAGGEWGQGKVPAHVMGRVLERDGSEAGGGLLAGPGCGQEAACLGAGPGAGGMVTGQGGGRTLQAWESPLPFLLSAKQEARSPESEGGGGGRAGGERGESAGQPTAHSPKNSGSSESLK